MHPKSPEHRRIAKRAHGKVAIALLNGTLVKPNVCESCKQDKPLFAHHDDYDKPLDVKWLCRSCHHKRHVELGDYQHDQHTRPVRVKQLYHVSKY